MKLKFFHNPKFIKVLVITLRLLFVALALYLICLPFYPEVKYNFSTLEEATSQDLEAVTEQVENIKRELPEYRKECFKNDYEIYKEMIETELINLGFSDIEVYYTGFYTGNDGLCFTGRISRCNFNEFLKKIGYKIKEDLILFYFLFI